MGSDSGSAEDAFADFVARRESGEDVDFEEWVKSHSDLEDRLRTLRDEWLEVASDIRRVFPGPPGKTAFFRRLPTTRSELAEVEKLGSLKAGDTLGEYRLIHVLGRGGQGTVWEAEQLALSRRVALKLLQPSRVSEKGIRFFEREGRAGGRLSHPGLVSIYAAGEVEGVHYIAEELVEGGWRLKDTLDEMHRLPELPKDYYRRVASFFVEVSDALQAAHDAGVIHRDIKPANILVTPGDRPKVTDFGLARLTDEMSLSRTGEMAGTYHYMSPEQVTAKRIQVDHRTDVFSLGIVLYEAMTLVKPFDGDTSQQVARKILFEDPPDPRAIRSRIPEELSLICAKAMEKDPRERYGSMLELSADLRRFLAGTPIHARPVGPVRRARKWSLRHPTLSSVLTLGAAALAVITLMLVDNVRARRSAVLLAADVMRLSAIQDLNDLITRADTLWPAVPDREREYVEWLEQARELVDGLPLHEATLAEIEARPRPWSREDRWWHGQLSQLRERLEAFADPDTGLIDGTSTAHGPGVARRLSFASALRERSVDGAQAAELWRGASSAVRASYGGLELSPQMGLLPIGPDPRTGLWEFAHLASGEPARRDPDTGELTITEETGLVLVLLPGGPFTMGAQNTDPSAARYFPTAMQREGPLHEVTLAPFFLSKFEMTQPQWEHFTGENPSYFEPGPRPNGQVVGTLHPVENMSWFTADTTLRRMGLSLPTEAQWEYGARGGTDGAWWTGDDVASLAGACNVADAFLRDNGGSKGWDYEDFDDGWSVHGPVGNWAPNPFGLHEVHGNVWEWCRDWYGSYEDPFAEGDGERLTENRVSRVLRGGSFTYPAADARVTVRYNYAPDYINDSLGVRPARPLD